MSERTDVIVLGSGVAGLSAALAASEMGLSPLLIEKSDLLGGGTCYSYGLIWVGENHIAREAGYEDNAADVADYVRFLCGGQGDETRMRTFLAHAPEMLRFFEAAGLRFRLVKGLTDHYHGLAPGSRAEGRTVEAELISGFDLGELQHKTVLPRTTPWFVTAEEQVSWGGMNTLSEWDPELVAERKRRDMRGMGLALACQFLRALRARSVPMRTGTRVARLTTARGRVTGVALDDGTRIAAARGVVITTGGYEANPEMMADYDNIPDWVNQYPDTVTGDGFVLAGEVGAAVRVIQNSLSFFLGFRIPGEGGAPPAVRLAGIIELCSPHTLVVNRQGQRFADETFFQGMVPALLSFDIRRHDLANLPCYMVFDRQYAEKFSFAGLPKGADIPAWVARADTPGALAERLGVDGPALEATIARFNEAVRNGVDEEFHRGEKPWRLIQGGAGNRANPSLGTVAEPPFYGVPLHPTGSGSAGLLTDETGRVLHHRRRPIPGLYASGNAAAHTEYGAGYQAGHSLASAMTFSMLAARHMAGQRRRGAARPAA